MSLWAVLVTGLLAGGEELDGVEECRTDRRRARSRVAYDPARVSADAIAASITEAGYRAHAVPLGG